MTAWLVGGWAAGTLTLTRRQNTRTVTPGSPETMLPTYGKAMIEEKGLHNSGQAMSLAPLPALTNKFQGSDPP
ncbi:hypothetical protein E2C01_065531 [Portunus trituberculatus]|uniref:Uncharacterized protein n=1 Tax=Portunus trituberculatus TaxID=210409 RepID=A0A5B7HFU0_PORTR|nr:hypothetical protein [Portunus trituberculatus]